MIKGFLCSFILALVCSCGITREDLEKMKAEINSRVDSVEKKTNQLSLSVEQAKKDSQKTLEGGLLELAARIDSALKTSTDAQKKIDSFEKLLTDLKSAVDEVKSSSESMKADLGKIVNELTLHRDALRENVHYRERLAELLRQMSANMRSNADAIDRAIDSLGIVEKNAKEKEQEKSDNALNDKVREQLHVVMRGKELLKKFPPDAGWGQEKFDELKKKPDLTAEEKEFVDGFPIWKKVKDLIDKVKKEAQEE